MVGINLILASQTYKCLLNFGLCTCCNANQFLLCGPEESYAAGPTFLNFVFTFSQGIKCLAGA